MAQTLLESDSLSSHSDLQAADGGVDLVFVSHRDDVRFEHLVDEEKPVCQLCSCLVEISRTHQLRAVMTFFAHQADHVNCRRYVRCNTSSKQREDKQREEVCVSSSVYLTCLYYTHL